MPDEVPAALVSRSAARAPMIELRYLKPGMSAGLRQTPIALAREASFRLGVLDVRPATLEVAAGDRRETLEPRVMQVLVALARQAGDVVSRDDLIASCWGGLVVGEDAIQRCISRLRRLASALGGGFELETVPRVGYRLVADARAPNVPDAPQAGDVLLAVLPFDNLSGDDGLVYFSDGVSEEILHTVARGTELQVIGRSSSFCFRGADKAARTVSRQLGATHVLDGSVRRSGAVVRVSVELVECQGQTSLWSARFDRDLADILALQDEVASAVAAALRTRFVRPAAAPKIDPAAYDLYLRSRPAPGWGHIPPSQAIGFLQKAVQLAPAFAPAWADLAHNLAAAYRGITLDPVGLPVARTDVIAAGERALALDADAGSAHIALGHLLPWSDYAGRQAAFERAFRAEPTSTNVRVELAWFLSSVGRSRDALDLAVQGAKLDPLDARLANLHGQMLCAVGRYEDGMGVFSDARSRWPDLPVFVSAPLMIAAAARDWPEVERLRSTAEGFKNPPAHLRDA